MKQSEIDTIRTIFDNQQCGTCPYKDACDKLEDTDNFISLCDIILSHYHKNDIDKDNDSLVSYSKSIKFIQDNVGNSLAAEYHKMFDKQ